VEHARFLAVLIVLVIMSLLVVGIRESARANAVIVSVKLAAVLFFLSAGAACVKPENWSPFAPFGWSGIMSAAAVVFFAYLGFDAVSTTAEEATNPNRDLPIGIIMSLLVCTALYLGVAAVLSGIVPVIQYRSTADALAGVPLVSPEESVLRCVWAFPFSNCSRLIGSRVCWGLDLLPPTVPSPFCRCRFESLPPSQALPQGTPLLTRDERKLGSIPYRP
jgi:amino acid transporter